MKAKNYFWVEYPKMYKDEINLSGLILKKDVSYKPEQNLILYGTVSVLPAGISKDLRVGDEIQIGDKIYFHYLAPNEDDIVEENGKKYLRVHVEHVFCYVRNGQIIMYRGYVLAKSVYDDDIEEIEVEGKKIKARVAPSGLVTSTKVDYRKNMSRICHIGRPLIGDPELDVVPGEEVYMGKNSQAVYEIEGNDYFVFEQDYLWCKISQG